LLRKYFNDPDVAVLAGDDARSNGVKATAQHVHAMGGTLFQSLNSSQKALSHGDVLSAGFEGNAVLLKSRVRTSLSKVMPNDAYRLHAPSVFEGHGIEVGFAVQGWQVLAGAKLVESPKQEDRRVL
jgi:hypothetical protein